LPANTTDPSWRFSPDGLKQKLAEDPQVYPFLNVFARLVREILNLKKHRQASAKEAALELKPSIRSANQRSRTRDHPPTEWTIIFLNLARRKPDADQANTLNPTCPETNP